MEESLQTAMYPHAHESRQAQLAASELWLIMLRTRVPGESAPAGLFSKGSAKSEDLIYGRFPRFGISAIDVKSRISHWVRKAAMSEEGQDLFEVLDADTLQPLDAKQLGLAVSEIFLQRLEVSRSRDRDLELARLWLREEIRKHEEQALALERRGVETEATRAIEFSSAAAIGGTVSYLLDNVGVHGIYTVAAGYGTAVAVALGSRYVVRRRPLLPRQVEYRLYVLEVLCAFLQSIFRMPVVRSVPVARSIVQQALSFQSVERSSVPALDGGRLPDTRGSPGLWGTHSSPFWQGDLVVNEPPPTGAFEGALIQLRSDASRLNDLGTAVTDPLVQAAVMRLEKVATTAQHPEDVYGAVIHVLDALSR
ncbi:hypothetical protein ACQRWP_11905 [Micromonospora trifolii]|uniref:hypothetical protein n=1 Tax=Micromonospora trifolii TaxID=2911208 RepID=UPI003D2F1638